MSDQPIHVVRQNGVLEITLDRPKANAIDAHTSRLLSQTFAEFRDDDSLRVAILTGAGERFFSAGWDLGAAADGEAFESDYGEGGFGGFPEMHDLHKPVICAVNGMAVGGGFEIAMSADFIVAADHARFFLPEARLGIIPDAGAIRLPKLLPRALANEIMLAGKKLDAQEAKQWGLVNHVCSADQLMQQARQLAEQLMESAPLSTAAVLQLGKETQSMTLPEAYAHMRSGDVDNYQKMLDSEDALEGPNAFAEKRSPVWKGC